MAIAKFMYIPAALLLSLATTAPSQPSVTNAAQEIVVLVSFDASTQQSSAPLSKNAKRLFQYLEAETKVHFHVSPVPWKRALISASSGQGFLYGAAKNSEREKHLKFSEPIFSDTVWLVKRCDSSLKFGVLSDLKDKSIGVIRGASYGDEFDQATNVIFSVQLDANSNEARFAKLLRKRTDALVIYSQVPSAVTLESDLNGRFGYLASAEAGDMKARPFCVLPKPVSTRSIHFAVAPGYDDQYLERLNAALIKARTSGKLGEIFSGSLSR